MEETNPAWINRCLIVSASCGKREFSALMTDCIPDLHLVGDSQCFPMFLYSRMEQGNPEIRESPSPT